MDGIVPVAATASGAFSTAYREHLGDDEGAIRDALPQTPTHRVAKFKLREQGEALRARAVDLAGRQDAAVPSTASGPSSQRH